MHVHFFIWTNIHSLALLTKVRHGRIFDFSNLQLIAVQQAFEEAEVVVTRWDFPLPNTNLIIFIIFVLGRQGQEGNTSSISNIDKKTFTSDFPS